MFWDIWPLSHQTEGCVPYRKEIFSLSRQRRRKKKELVTLTKRCRKSRALLIPMDEAEELLFLLKKLRLPEIFSSCLYEWVRRLQSYREIMLCSQCFYFSKVLWGFYYMINLANTMWSKDFGLGWYFLLIESLTQAPQSRAGCLASHCKGKSFIV